MTSLAERGQIIAMVQEAMDSGARQDQACTVINLNERTLQRWQVDQSRGDQRPERVQTPTNRQSRAGARTSVDGGEFRGIWQPSTESDRADTG